LPGQSIADVPDWSIIRFRRARTGREFVTEGLDSAPAAFMGLLKGANFGKQLARVGPDKA
jgi:hypothetical protein